MKPLLNNHPFLKWIPALHEAGPFIWLDSADGGTHGSRYSFLAGNPVKIVSKNVIKHIRANRDTNFWESFQKEIVDSKTWWFGYISYQAKNAEKGFESQFGSFVKMPDLSFFQPGFLARLDHESGKVDVLIGNPPEESALPDWMYTLHSRKFGEAFSAYSEKITEIKRLIREGEFYESNYTIPILGKLAGNPFAAYLKARSVMKAPFSAYCSFSQADVLCFSPERFLKRSGEMLLSEPIKGTRQNDESAESNAVEHLAASDKDKAEHLMIVDLVRNDFSRVCEPGSVIVQKPFEIRSFKSVHQMVSMVEGRVAPKARVADILKACFPMGSMTGAPKKRVMEYSDKLECWQRGLYSGALGYIMPNGDFDFNVVIRTLVVQNEEFYYGVGGAITSDSTAEDEWLELETKSAVLNFLANKKD